MVSVGGVSYGRRPCRLRSTTTEGTVPNMPSQPTRVLPRTHRASLAARFLSLGIATPVSLLPVLASLVILGGLVACSTPGADQESASAVVVEAATPRPAPRWTTVADTVRRGDTLSGVLLRNRVGVQEIGQILHRMRTDDLFSPRSLRPGQVLTVSRDAFGGFRQLRFEVSREDVLVFEAVGDSVEASYADLDREVRLRKFEGEIRSSFDEAVQRSGGDYRLTLKVADLMAYDIDFMTQPRVGDRFEVLVEEKFIEGEFLGYGEIVYANYDGALADCEAFYYEWGDGADGHYLADGRAMKKAFLKSPLNFRRISSHFGKRFHPIRKVYKHHTGVDYAASSGTPVVALGDGVVDYCGWKGGYGNAIRIRHNKRMQTLYGHLKGFAKGVAKGTRVEQNQVIGYVGKTGLATGPHLHFEMIENGRQIDPLAFDNEPAEPIPAEHLEEYLRWAAQVRDLEHDLLAGQIVPPIRPGDGPSGTPDLASFASDSE